MRLIDLQRSFRELVFDGDASVFSAQIEVGGKGSKAQRVEVYRNNVRQGLLRVLQQIFPVCCRVLSTRHFLPAARGYIVTSDSSERDLNFYGADFPDFLQQLCETHPQLGRHRFLPDLARLEWHFHLVYYTADDSDFDFFAFDRVVRNDRDAVVLQPSHSLSLLSTEYPLLEIHRRFGTREQVREEAEYMMDDADLMTRYICIYRERWRPALEYIDERIYRLMDAIRSRTPLLGLAQQFPSVGKSALDQSKTGQSGLDEMLPVLIEKGWVSGFAGKMPKKNDI